MDDPAKIAELAINAHFQTLGECMPDLVAKAAEGIVMLPEESDMLTVFLWMQFAAATSAVLEKTTGKKQALIVPEKILDLAARHGVKMKNPHTF